MFIPKRQHPTDPVPDEAATKEARQLGTKSMSRICGILAALALCATAFAVWSQVTSLQRYSVLEEQTCEVVVATADVLPGTTLGDSALQIVAVPVSIVPSDAITNKAEAVGKTTVDAISAHSIVTQSACSSDESATLAGRVGSDKVAVTVGVTQQSGNAGLVHQGDHVTLLGAANNGDLTSAVLAEHARVMAVDSSLDAHKDDYTSLTVEVSAPQAILIATAESHGDIMVALEPAN